MEFTQKCILILREFSMTFMVQRPLFFGEGRSYDSPVGISSEIYDHVYVAAAPAILYYVIFAICGDCFDLQPKIIWSIGNQDVGLVAVI